MTTLKEFAEYLAPSRKEIPIGDTGKTLEIRGLSGKELAEISRRFPEFGELMNQGREAIAAAAAEAPPPNGEAVSPEAAAARQAVDAATAMQHVDIGKALGLGSGAYPAIIATGCGQAGDAETEEIAAGFAPNSQKIIVQEILALTFPPDPAPLPKGDGIPPLKPSPEA